MEKSDVAAQVVTAMTTGLTELGSTVTSAYTSIIPVAIGVLGLGVVVGVCIGVFRRIAHV